MLKRISKINIFENMRDGFKGLLGLQTLEECGCVDSIEIGRSQLSTCLSICKKGDTLFLEITQRWKSFLQSSTSTFYCDISPKYYNEVYNDLKRIIDVLKMPENVTVKRRWFSRIVYRMLGYRIIGDLGHLSMTDGVYKSTGLIMTRKENHFFLWTEGSWTNCSWSSHLFSETAIKGILATLDTCYGEMFNDNQALPKVNL